MQRIETDTRLLVTLGPTHPQDAPAPPRSRSRSRAALKLRGLCPVCGEEAPRRFTATASELRETYCCPVDGETVYRVDAGGRRLEVAGDAQRNPTATPIVELGEPIRGTGFARIKAAV